MLKLDTSISAALGILFLLLGTGTMFLMFYLWGFPFDKATRTSEAPKSLMRLHRVLGFLYAALYIFMMMQMVPRMFAYQVEFPPRTVAHICLGITIGFILIVKIAIIRFFRHLEEWMPYLGVLMVLCTFLLAGLSVPFSLREQALSRKTAGGSVFSDANVARLKELLPAAGLPKEAPIDQLATLKSLHDGRKVLMTQCVGCHDLRTVLTRPRPPSDWVRTVERMVEKPVLDDPISPKQQWAVTAYLIAITPELQSSAKKARAQKMAKKATKAAAQVDAGAPEAAGFTLEKVKPAFDAACTGCHELDDVDTYVWTNDGDAKIVMDRMVENGLEATAPELASYEWYLKEKYIKPKKK